MSFKIFCENPKFIVKKSLIPKAGNGVFALENIKKYELIGEYKGELITPKEYERRNNKKGLLYVWQLEDKDGDIISYIDGDDPEKSNFTRYVNSPSTEEEENILIIQKKFKIFYYASRNIKKGEELYVWYGEGYAKYLGLI